MDKYGTYNSFDFNVGAEIYTISEEEVGRSLYGFILQSRYQFFSPVEWFSLSFDAPAGIGFDYFASSGGNVYGFYIKAPLTIDFNIGAGAYRNSDYVFGFFGGSGINYSYNTFGFNDQSKTIHLLGPYFHAGFRWRQAGFLNGIMISYSFALPTPNETINGVEIRNSITKQAVGISYLYWF